MTSSPALEPSLDGPSPSQRQFLPLDGKRSHSHHYSTTTTVLFIVASLACIQSVRYYGGWSRVQDSSTELQGRAAGQYGGETGFFGRNWQRRVLQQQLYERDQEVQYLRKELESAVAVSRSKEHSMSASDERVRSLQDRADGERAARGKAQLALAEKASNLQTCVTQRDTLQAEVERCSQSLILLNGRRY